MSYIDLFNEKYGEFTDVILSSLPSSMLATDSLGNIIATTINTPLSFTTPNLTLNYTTNFKLTTGSLDTIQDIKTSSSPTFTGLTLSGLASTLASISAGGVFTTTTISNPLLYSGSTLSLQYNTTNLKLTASQLNTIQDIATSSSPSFTGLTLSGLVSRLVSTSAGGLLQSTTVSLPLTFSSNTLALGYNTTNLKLTSNQLNTIQDIATSSSPQFTNLTVTTSGFFTYLWGRNTAVNANDTLYLGSSVSGQQFYLDRPTTNAAINIGYNTAKHTAFNTVFNVYNNATDKTQCFSVYSAGTGSGINSIYCGVNVGLLTSTPGQALEIGGVSKQIYLNSSTTNMIRFNTQGSAPPSSVTARSVGTKVILSDTFASGSAADYALGIDTSTLWYSTGSTTAQHKWFHGANQTMALSTTGLTIGSTTITSMLNIGTAAQFRVDGSGNVAAGTWQGTVIGVAFGGVGTSLQFSGGPSRVLMQVSTGANITVSQLTAANLANGTTGSNAVVLATSPVLVTPNIGTPSAGTLTNCTGYPASALSGTVSLTTQVTGVLPLANGGTNANLTAAVGSIVYSSSTALALLSPPASNNCVLLGMTSTNPIWSTTTYPSVTASGDMLYASAANVLSRVAIGTSGQVLSVSGGFPVWTTIPGTSSAALTKTDDTNVTLTLGGAPSTALLTATSLTLGWTGLLGLSRGGCNFDNSASSAGSVCYSTGTTIQTTAAGTSNQVLVSNGSSAPSWSSLSSIGVSSVAGTSNQINASASTGSVTLSLSSTAVMPGTLGITTMNETNINPVIYAGGILYTNSSGVVKQNPYELYYDSTNAHVGINLNTPSKALHVCGDGLVADITSGTTVTEVSSIISIGSGGGTNAVVVLGSDFTVGSKNLIVTAFGAYAQGGSFADTYYQVALYDYNSQVQIYSCNVLNSATTEADGFKYYTLPSPFTLTAGTKYQILCRMTNTPLIYRTSTTTTTYVTWNQAVSAFGSVVPMAFLPNSGGPYRTDYEFGPMFKFQPCSNRLVCTTSATGVGTSTPRKQLDVLDASAAQLRLTYTDNSVYSDFTTNSSGYLVVSPSGSRVGIGTANPRVLTDFLSTSTQLRLTYSDNTVYTNFTTDTNGYLTVSPTGSRLEIAGGLKLSTNPTVTSDNTNAWFWNQSGVGPTIGGNAVQFFTNGNNTRLTIQNSGSIVPGSAALSTSATDGFVYEETCAGKPSGTPTSYTGRVAQVYDTTNNVPWVYNGSWLAGNGMVLISKNVLGAGAASVTFSSISGVFNHLRIITVNRIDAALSATNFGIRFNGDTGNNYNTSIVDGSNGSAGNGYLSGTNQITYAGLTIGTNIATYPMSSVIDIPCYTNTTFYKTINGSSGGGTGTSTYTRNSAGVWANTAAITSITLLAPSGNFIAGSIFYLYGVY